MAEGRFGGVVNHPQGFTSETDGVTSFPNRTPKQFVNILNSFVDLKGI